MLLVMVMCATIGIHSTCSGAFHMSTVRPASPTSSLLAYPTPYVIKMKMDLPVDFEVRACWLECQ